MWRIEHIYELLGITNPAMGIVERDELVDEQGQTRESKLDGVNNTVARAHTCTSKQQHLAPPFAHHLR